MICDEALEIDQRKKTLIIFRAVEARFDPWVRQIGNNNVLQELFEPRYKTGSHTWKAFYLLM